MGEGDQLLIEVPFLWDKSYKKINIDHEIYVRNPTRTVCTKIQVALEERNPHPVPLARTNRVTKKLTMTDLVRTFDALRPFGVHIAFSDIFHHLHEARLISRSIGGVWFQNNLERILFFFISILFEFVDSKEVVRAALLFGDQDSTYIHPWTTLPVFSCCLSTYGQSRFFPLPRFYSVDRIRI